MPPVRASGSRQVRRNDGTHMAICRRIEAAQHQGAPTAMLAMLACWYARPLAPRDAIKLLGSYLVLMLVAIQIA